MSIDYIFSRVLDDPQTAAETAQTMAEEKAPECPSCEAVERFNDAFDFVHDNGFKWIPCKDKRPLESWKTKGKIYEPDDMSKIQECRQRGINQIAFPTEENHLVVIDCDVVPKDKDERSRDPKYQAFLYGENFNAGALNLINLLDQKGKESNNHILVDLSCVIWDFFNYGLPCGDHDLPAPLNCIVQTPTGGIHFYFKCEDSSRYSSNSSKLAPCVDVRAKGGIIIAPRSVRKVEQKKGEKAVYFPEYLPLAPFNEMSVLTPEIAALLPTAAKEEQEAVTLTRASIPLVTDFKAVSKDAKRFIKWQEDFRREAVKGARNSSLSKYIGRSFRLRTVTPCKVEEVFRSLAQSVGLKANEITSCINSAKRYANQKGVFAS